MTAQRLGFVRFFVIPKDCKNCLLFPKDNPFFKQEKKVIKTKELKIEKETKEEVSEIDSLRGRYLEKFDKEADKRWKESRLIDELENDWL